MSTLSIAGTFTAPSKSVFHVSDGLRVSLKWVDAPPVNSSLRKFQAMRNSPQNDDTPSEGALKGA